MIPELKLTDRGLVDVGEFRLVGMFLGKNDGNIGRLAMKN